MTWFAFHGLNGGQAIDLAGLQEKEAVGEGFHGYASQSEAQANPNGINPITRMLADVLIADYKAAVSTKSQPGGVNASNPLGQIAQSAKNILPSIPGVGSIDDLISFLKQGAIWERGGEILLGFILLYVGLRAMTGLDPVRTATKTVRTARKVIP